MTNCNFNRFGWLTVISLSALGALSGTGLCQQFQNVGGTNVPNLALHTEAAKFGDWDLDGDLDLVYANGGDVGNEQSKLLINNGLAQAGTVGFYTDRTSTQLLASVGNPVFVQSSRDVEPFDIDNDGDLDFYISNHSMNGNQSNTWFINQGGAQAGTAGVFILDMSRWVAIGGAHSSIPAAQKITTGNFSGGFIDWSCQCDFADVDLDGDFDLLHGTYGSSFSGGVMSRLFLNDGTGFFREYNPSSAVSANPNLATGSQAGFAEGDQVNDTMDTTGLHHDITNVALDVDFSDFDGDFDNDLQSDSRDTQQRMYQSRFWENGGGLGNGSTTRLYRDVTGSWLQGAGGLSESPGANYDNDFHDMDNDNDVDGYFLGYIGTTDKWAVNDGAGHFTGFATVPNSANDDNEIDWHDYDNDGDADPFISAFSGSDRFYKNQFVETASINLIQITTLGTGLGTSTLGSDIGDMDNDGDTDIICAEDGGANEVLLKNTLNVPDPIAPRVPHIIQLANGNPTSTPRAVVTRVFDNVNDEYFRTATGVLNYTVNGNPHTANAKWSGGNLWHATFPGYWYGTINYSMSVTDRRGNTGTSPTKTVTVPLTGFSTFGSEISGCNGAYTIGVNSAPTINNPDFAMTCPNTPPNTTQLLLATNSLGTGIDEFGVGIPIWADLISATEVYGLDANSDGAGFCSVGAVIPNVPALIGVDYYFQFIVGDFGCGNVLSTSMGGHIVIQP